MFRRTPVVTIRTSIEAFRLKLWDTETESLVPFPSGRRSGRRDGVAALGEAAVLARGKRVAPNQLIS
jgi:hypothetical protein